MPNYLTAKRIAELSLRVIGTFPPSRKQADANELQTALEFLELLLNSKAGMRPFAGLWRLIDIPLEAGVGDYLLSDYVDEDEASHVFSVGLVQDHGDVCPLRMLNEDQALEEDLNCTGTPARVHVTKDLMPSLRVFPTPTQTDEDNGRVLRLRIQTYFTAIDPTGITDSDTQLRPAWYLWAIKALALEVGGGPVRYLPEQQLTRLQATVAQMESLLFAGDGIEDTGMPAVTEPGVG